MRRRLTEERRRVLFEERVAHRADTTGSSVGSTFNHATAARFTEDCSTVTTVQLKEIEIS